MRESDVLVRGRGRGRRGEKGQRRRKKEEKDGEEGESSVNQNGRLRLLLQETLSLSSINRGGVKRLQDHQIHPSLLPPRYGRVWRRTAASFPSFPFSSSYSPSSYLPFLPPSLSPKPRNPSRVDYQSRFSGVGSKTLADFEE